MGSRVAVVGGGVAGITAALDCAEAGAQVTLVEVRRRLGGAAYSVQREGLQVDNGQHVFLRCCVAYRAFLARIGGEQHVSVQPRLDIPVLSPGRPAFNLRRGLLPAPFQLAGSLMRFPHLSLAQRISASRAALALMRLSRGLTPQRARALDDQTFGEWLSRHGQAPDAIGALWDLIALPTLNLRAAEASLGLAAFVFHEGLFAAADAADIGFHRATLGETIAAPAQAALRDAGVEARLGWRAERLVRGATGFEIGGRRGREAAEQDEGLEDALQADAVIVALPHSRAASLVEGLLGDVARRVQMLQSSPIVNLHVLYDRPVCEESFAAGVGTPAQYVFDRTLAGGAPAGSQYLAVSLSGADREMRMSVDELRERYLPALGALFPRARGAVVDSFLVTREHAATFRPAPGSAALRPPSDTAVDGLALAGAWTDTGWPATLEGAVLSGHSAARAALRALALDGPAPMASAAGARGEPMSFGPSASRR